MHATLSDITLTGQWLNLCLLSYKHLIDQSVNSFRSSPRHKKIVAQQYYNREPQLLVRQHKDMYDLAIAQTYRPIITCLDIKVVISLFNGQSQAAHRDKISLGTLTLNITALCVCRLPHKTVPSFPILIDVASHHLYIIAFG